MSTARLPPRARHRGAQREGPPEHASVGPDTPAPAHAPVAVDDALLRAWPLPACDERADKESRGRVLVVGGSREVPGAAVLAGVAALRAGAGKLAIATPGSAWSLVAAAVPEARVVPLGETAAGGPGPGAASQLAKLAGHAAAVLIGPGMLDPAATIAFVDELLPHCGDDCVVVLDALAMDRARGRHRFARPVLLTPHAGEMAHLTGRSKDELVADGDEAAHGHARDWNAVVALKGARTVIADPAGRTWVHEGATPGLATSGSGDVLAGIIAGLAARGATLQQATVWGVALHARAGARLAQQVGDVGFLARELAPLVPGLMQELGRQT